MPEAEPNFYLMDFMPPGGSDAQGSNLAAASVSGLMMPTSASSGALVQPTLESTWMSSLYPSLFMPTVSSSAASSGVLATALQQPQQGMIMPGSGPTGQGNLESIFAALGGGTATSQYGFMRPTSHVLPSASAAVNRLPALGGESSLLSMLNSGTLPQMPSFEPSNADLMQRNMSVAAANLHLRNPPAYGQERDSGNILLDAYAAALQSEFTEPRGTGSFTQHGHPSSSEDSFRDFFNRNSSS
jgi:hypothetical protein